MTEYLIRAVDFANGAPCPFAGQWLKEFDFDADDGRGFGVFTDNRAEAVRFGSRRLALLFWRTTSSIKPIREDGEPNRPLTAMSIDIEEW